MAGNWRDEIDWRVLRLVARGHVALWVYGAALAGLHIAGILEGVLRDALALGAFAGLAICLLLIFRIVRTGNNTPEKPKPEPGRVSSRTFLVLIGFFVSVAAFVLLLSFLGLNGVSIEF